MATAKYLLKIQQHKLGVLRLYKRVLKVNKQLPLELRQMGNSYVRDEFKRHKSMPMNDVNVKKFLNEWKMYADQLEAQFKQGVSIGSNLSLQEMDYLSEDQLGQLYQLQQESIKPDVNTN